jgi:hypothetical protein
MEMNFPHKRHSDAQTERSKEFELLIAAAIARQASVMEAKSPYGEGSTSSCADPLADRISFFGAAFANAGKGICGSFLPQKTGNSAKVNETKADVYLAGLANGKSTNLMFALPDQPVALRGMEN